MRASNKRNGEGGEFDLFDHFGLTEEDHDAEIEAYQHHMKWSNRMILGDGLQVMASLVEREGLKGQVQAIYIDPPYGIKFNSNFQWSTTSRDVKDGKLDHVTREPEQVRAFRDTWRDGIHSYLGYLRDRLVVARELLTESGSCFVQIGDENVHRVRALMDEVFGDENFVSEIIFTKTTGLGSTTKLAGRYDVLLWFAKSIKSMKYRRLYEHQEAPAAAGYTRIDQLRPDFGPYMSSDLTKPGPGQKYAVRFVGRLFDPGRRWWGYPPDSLERMARSGRIEEQKTNIRFIKFFNDYPVAAINNLWLGFGGASSPQYVVQTNEAIIARCLLMTTDPGDLVLDPTCGSGTTAHAAEQWGRRWITIDTSRVALALARARIMGAKYPWYHLADSEEGQKKEAEVTRKAPATTPTYHDIRHGFVYNRVPHITLKSIANNTEIDTIWDTLQPAVEETRSALNAALLGHSTLYAIEAGGRGSQIDFTAKGEVEMPSGEMAPANGFMEWEIPREAPAHWPEAAKSSLSTFWDAVARQKEIDASIAAKADFEYPMTNPMKTKTYSRCRTLYSRKPFAPPYLR